MNDTYVETTRTSWLSRIKSAIAGIIIGPLVIAGTIYFLGWNEGRSAGTIAALEQGKKEVVAITPDTLNPGLEGKLVYSSGPVKTSEVLSDPLFGVSKNALWLRRDAEMYQWKEDEESKTEKNVGGSETTTKTYRYSKTWSSSPINSSSFKDPAGHTNPNEMKVDGATFVAQNARLGVFRLDDSLVRSIDGEQTLVVPAEQRSSVFPDAKVYEGGFYLGNDPVQPQVGDIRVRFSAVPPSIASVVAAQVGDNLSGYSMKNGYVISLIRAGTHTADALFDRALMENTLITWGLRLLGLVLLFVGFSLPLRILSVLADVVPFIGSLVELGTGFIAFVFAAVAWVATIAISWFAHRPVHAGLLVAVMSGLILILYRRRAARRASQSQAA